ncbi:1,4-dihydroxy-2-naphthoate polyprenyltransferase [Cytophagales bacterium LB-30]|uniref:1,4-dihydroxy-2-naphthoate octaprenyltransferase n=1 Tax=Shiella aurantiaca TaxID=3058365 RepID=A0ABT8F3F2_9BACT|nr:1,4-dihydroxy-2-naphthoate polyprenyltransferase [Shiella aurantiaca]MDN4164980.1 1,4-dihydroxy-2-naphthoate polyprenyltransferase [Shiella aurantiaca]
MAISVWLKAARLRTLPLALASIIMGSFLAAYVSGFRWSVFVLAVLTTLLLQVLSNFANDYGDSVHGADSAERQGPDRAVSSGAISPKQMKMAVGLFALAALLAGLSLLWVALGANTQVFLTFLGLGIASILAAITYTMGKKPYGYAGLGDISVLIFFGLVGVIGTFYLHTQRWEPGIVFPAISCGLFAVAVLNLNNIRDIESDRKAGKRSIPVRLGRKKAVVYHQLLLYFGLLAAMIFTYTHYQSPWQWLFLLSLPLMVRNIRAVATKLKPQELDPYLKQMALTTLFFVLTFGIGLLIS